jgi:TonB family protein
MPPVTFGRFVAVWSLAGLALSACASPQGRPAPPATDMLARPAQPGWSIDPRSGCWIWNPNPRADETVTWSGRCYPGGPATGTGVMEWRYGGRVSRYEGDLREGRPHGRGIFTAPNGNRYEGEHREGKRHGRGVFTFANGDRYDGEYRDDKPNGIGTFTSSKGTWSGPWNDGCLRQAGRWAYANTTAAACGFVLAPPVSQRRPDRGGILGAVVDLNASSHEYRAFRDEVRRRIQARSGYPCVTNPANQACDYFQADVLIEFGILTSGRLQFVDLRRSSGLAVYDEYAINAVKLAAPYPEVPAELMATRPGSTGVAISISFAYAPETAPSGRPRL